MARLLIRLDGSRDHAIELRLGVNRLGRASVNEFPIDHPSVSARHCHITLGSDGVWVRDCESTNGTFIDGRQIVEEELLPGQTLRLGDVEILVDNTDVKVAIPKIDVPIPAPPVVLGNGSMVCPRHPEAVVTHQCTHCLQVLCDRCVRRIRRRGGKTLKLCPLCSRRCVPLGGEKRRKYSFLSQLLEKTVKLPFLKAKHPSEDD